MEWEWEQEQEQEWGLSIITWMY